MNFRACDIWKIHLETRLYPVTNHSYRHAFLICSSKTVINSTRSFQNTFSTLRITSFMKQKNITLIVKLPRLALCNVTQ